MAYSSITIKDIPSIVMSSLVLSVIPLFAVIFVLDEIDKNDHKDRIANHSANQHVIVNENPETFDGMQTGTMSVTDGTVAGKGEYAKVTSTSYNNIARFIAGMPQLYKNEFTGFEGYPSWARYSATAGKKWKELGENKFRKIIAFRDSELREINKEAKTVFYPFSGPDFLHSNLFFPNATEYILIGLEKVGELPDMRTLKNDSLMAHYISYINRSLRDVLSLSFFITKKMKTDFKNNHLEGLLPALMVFVVRSEHVVLDIRFFNIGSDGAKTYLAKGFNGQSTGVEITFKDNNNIVKNLTYLSVNLADGELKKDGPTFRYLSGIGKKVTYLKAASYLMHNNYFGAIRDYILKTSFAVLQDDSGIPYRFFASKEWSKKLYGSYSSPIGLFAGKRQKDLAIAYERPDIIKTLDFGIGYKHRKGSSNLMLAVKDLSI